MKFTTSFAAALVCACAIGVHAQETKTKTETKVDGSKDTVTFTGCVQSGTESRTYVLDKVVPVKQTRTTEVTGTSGTVTTTATTYALVPGEQIELQPQVGHKVEVTGVVVPAGESKTHTQTKIEREHGKDVKVDEKTKTDTDRPQLRVIAVKQLAESCM
jgi:hypothetical protein